MLFLIFCLINKIKLVCKRNFTSLGNKGKGHVILYAFTKAKNLELLENLKKWFKFNYEIVYFYNIYGPSKFQQVLWLLLLGF